MNDAPSAIDPLVAEGPRTPVETLRPMESLQRLLLLDEPGPMMVDLATSDIRRYESGPPVSVPMVSDTFDLGAVRRLQVQLIADPRPSSTSDTLFALNIVSARCLVDVRVSATNQLELIPTGSCDVPAVSVPAGASPAFVIVIETAQGQVTVSARNAETLDFTSLVLDVADLSEAVLTVGGPSVSTKGRRHTIPVHIDIAHHGEPVDQLRRAARGVRRVAGSIRDKVG